MKKALAWLDAESVAYDFHDYKVEGIDKLSLGRWCKDVGRERLLNRAGTTLRKLADKDREDINERKAIDLKLAQPSMIKRPVLDLGRGRYPVGFKPENYATALGKAR